MAAWGKEEVDAARHRQEKRGNETANAVTVQERVDLQSNINLPSRRVEGILYGCQADRDLRST